MHTFAQKPKATQQSTIGTHPVLRSDHSATTRVAYDFSRIPIHTAAPAASGDIYEREADHVAEQVMLTPEPQRLPETHAGSSNSGPTAAPSIIDKLASPGRSLDPATRSIMESRFGHDFSRVRVHSGAEAEQSARAVNANAYTVGQDIVFGASQFAPQTHEGRRLIAHELTHVVQQAGVDPSLQRQPRPDVRPDIKSPEGSPKLTPFVVADRVLGIKRDNETWVLTIEGSMSPENARRVIWPRLVPPGITIDMKAVLTDPIEGGWFAINGLTPDAVGFMEPSIAKLFSDRGLVEEAKESEELRKARHAFLARHSDHSDQVLLNIVVSLDRITKRNPELLLAYYNYYADNFLRDETQWNDHISDKDYDPDKHLGATAYGGTVINPAVLEKTKKFPTDDPTSLLAGTLIHEFVHTPQGGGDTGVHNAPKEAKAYGIERFFAERMGDQKRADVIKNKSWDSPVDLQTRADIIYLESYNTIEALYEVIDQGGPSAREARVMSVEFISKNQKDYGPKLKAFISKHRG